MPVSFDLASVQIDVQTAESTPDGIQPESASRNANGTAADAGGHHANVDRSARGSTIAAAASVEIPSSTRMIWQAERRLQQERREQHHRHLHDDGRDARQPEIQPQRPRADASVAFDEALAGRCRVARAELEERVLEDQRQQDDAREGEAGVRAGARRLHEMRDANGRRGPQQARTERRAECRGRAGTGHHPGNPGTAITRSACAMCRRSCATTIRQASSAL